MKVLRDILMASVTTGTIYLGFVSGIVFFQVLFYLFMFLNIVTLFITSVGGLVLKFTPENTLDSLIGDTKPLPVTKSELIYKGLFLTLPFGSLNTFLLYTFNPYLGTFYVLTLVASVYTGWTVLKQFWSRGK